jgi:hypothetical protein
MEVSLSAFPLVTTVSSVEFLCGVAVVIYSLPLDFEHFPGKKHFGARTPVSMGILHTAE